MVRNRTRKEVKTMEYNKPELALVGQPKNVVLGGDGPTSDSFGDVNNSPNALALGFDE
jgi:hypothetical protein